MSDDSLHIDKTFPFWKNLSFRLITSFLTLALIPLALIVTLNVRSSGQALEGEAHKSLDTYAAYSASNVESFLQSNLSIIRTEALLPIWSDYLNMLSKDHHPGRSLKSQTMQTLETLQQKDSVFITSYSLLDVAGNVVLSTAHNAMGHKLSDRLDFKQALETGLPYVSDVLFDLTGNAFFYFSCPVVNEKGTPVGVLRVKYSATILQQLIIQSTGLLGPRSFTMLVNKNGLILGYGIMSYGGASDILLRTFVPIPPENARHLIQSRHLPGDYVTRKRLNYPELYKGLQNLDNQSSVFSTKLPGTGETLFAASTERLAINPWTVIAFQPQETFFHLAKTQVRQALIIAVLLSLTVLLSALGWAYWLSRPVRELTTVAKRISDGDLSATSSLALTSTSEISILAKTFNIMTSRLRRKIEAESIISLAARKLISCSADEFDNVFHEILKDIGTFSNIDRLSVLLFTDKANQQLIETYSWANNDTDQKDLSTADISKCSELLSAYHNDTPFIAEDLQACDLSRETAAFWNSRNSRSAAGITLASSGARGFITMEMLKQPKTWSGTDLHLLRLTADIISQAIERQRLEEENQKSEQRLRQSEKMEAIGTLVGGVAHDFNNLLQGISGYIQLLMLKKKPDDKEYDFLDKAHQAVIRAADLVQQLLTFSRKMEVKPTPMNINQVIETTLHLLERTIPKMVSITTRLQPDLPMVLADATQIEQVLVNLANNSVDAMDGKGSLTFESSLTSINKKDTGLLTGQYIQLRVTDTGKGMDEETRRRIFEPFFTTKEVGKGTGLGLSSAYAIIEQHQGSIHCHSEPGQGTCFTIYLPLADNNTLESSTSDKQRLPAGNESILLVDDEADILDFAGTFLKDLGYHVTRAETAEQALERLQTENKHFDIVLMDLGMPGIGGEEGLQQLRKQFVELKVLIASGYASHPISKAPQNYGAAGFIAKPYHLEELAKAIRSILDAS